MPVTMDYELFLTVWNEARSATEASVMLQRAGYRRMTPRRTLEWARCMRAFGIRMKRMARANLPRLRDLGWLRVH
jgi:hypothetical protein